MVRLAPLFLLALFSTSTPAMEGHVEHLSAFGPGPGPELTENGYRLLDENRTPGQSNAVAFDVGAEGAFEQVALRCQFRVLPGGEGGAFIFLNTAEYGRHGPAPFLKNWAEPSLRKTFAVGIDVHNPPTDDLYGPGGNFQGLPEREVSLHWDGREVVKRIAPVEFRGDFVDCEIAVRHVIGGAEITVRIAGGTVFDRYFLPGMLPYETRFAIGAGTRSEATTEFDVRNIEFTVAGSARPQRHPSHFELFNHVMIAGGGTSGETEASLPPSGWAFGRVILTLEIHDAGRAWDQWDRAGHFYVTDPAGIKRDIVPFITSFRTPCRWLVDVTPFRPWLAGETAFEITVETEGLEDQGFMMSAALDFYHGSPKLEPYRIEPLWNGTAAYKSAANHFSDFFPPRVIDIDETTRAARLFITATGHSPVGEFTPSRRTVIFVPAKMQAKTVEHRFENVLWKTDGYLNPNRPQFGTWKFPRAGWAPGDIVRPWWIDLTPFILPGSTAELRYEPEPYDFSGIPREERPTEDQVDQARQIVRAYLISYRAPTDMMAAPLLRVLNVLQDSNAEKAGIRAGDYLERYDGVRPDSIESLRKAIREAAEAGKKRVPAVIYRGGRRMEMILGPGLMGVLLEET